MDSIVERAERFAAEKHAGQMRKCGLQPYITHPAELVASLRRIGVEDESILAAAWLHDTVEDTDATLPDIYEMFGEAVGGLVDVLSRRKLHESREHYHNRVLAADHRAKIVKIADIEHNLRTVEHLDEEGRERKFHQARHLYLPLREELCGIYSGAEELFDRIEEHLASWESAEDVGGAEAERKTYVVVRQEWRESERGWGQRPDGYSLHLSLDDLEKYVEAYWERMPDSTPECYSFPSGSPRACDVDEELYKEIEESEHGIRRY